MENLREAMEKVKSQTSDLLRFTLQWSDLEEYIKFKEMELEKRSVALEERAKVVEAAEAKLGDLEKEIQEKTQHLDYLNDRIYCYQSEYTIVEMNLKHVKTAVKECTLEHTSMTGHLNKTQVELQSKGEQLAQMKTDLERLRVEVSAETEHLGCSQTRRRELDEHIEKKTKVLAMVLDKTLERERLLQTLSLEFNKTQDKLELRREQLRQMKIDLEWHHNKLSSEKEKERKSKECEAGGSNVSLPNQQVVASGSSAFKPWSQHQAGFKRPRMDPPGPSGRFQ